MSRKRSWWYGWVKYSYYDPFSKSEREAYRSTYYDFDTAGQAKRAADALAGGLAAPQSLDKYQRQYHSKTEKRPSQLKILETGASRVDEKG